MRIREYEITVKDQYKPATLTTHGSPIQIRRFPSNGTSVVANRVYNITVSPISYARKSYPGDSIIVSKFSCIRTMLASHIRTYVRIL